MACTNTVKPDMVSRPTNIYGAPQGQAGRTFDGNDFGIQAIILHCTDMTISQYVQYIACLTQPVLNTSEETTHHYSIGSAGALNQHINDANISWTFGAYSAETYPSAPTPTRTIQWPTLQNLNGGDVSPDVYAINILVAKSYNQGTACLTSTGLPSDQHDKLMQLIAYLSETYNIPIDADHIQWHDNIATQACPSNECNCTDVACLIRDINSYCDESDCNGITYSEVDCDSVTNLLAIPDNCGNSSGCIVSIPFDACCLGHLPIDGEIEQFVGLALDDTTNKLCLVKNSVSVTAPLTGDGTAANPLALDRCLFGEFVPDGNPVTVLGIDVDGCLVETVLSSAVPGLETPLTVIDTSTIDLTAGGTSGHELTASVKLSTATDNLLTSDASGLYVSFGCDDLDNLFEPSTDIVNFFGVDSNGDCVFQHFEQAVSDAICNTLTSNDVLPMHILGRDANLTCPVFYTPAQVVLAGLGVDDTSTINLTMAPVGSLNVITASVNVSPAADNVLMVTQDGLYVAPIQAQSGDTCLDVEVVDGVITISNIIDPKAENILQCGPDGLCVTDIVAVDTDCFDMTYNAATREISGSIILAPDQSNISNVATCIPGQGFYVPRGARLLIDEPLTGDGSETNPLDIDFSLMDNEDLCDLGFIIPETTSLFNVVGTDDNKCLRLYTGEQFIAEFLDIQNGNCITATLTGNILNIEPRISAAIGGIGNMLSCTATGLYVPAGAGITAVDTNCIALQLVNGVLTSTISLNLDPDNQVTCTDNGLFVGKGAGVAGEATDCINVSVTDGVVSATPIISAAIGGINNILTCEPGGLYVPLGAGIVAGDTDCLEVALNTATGELEVTPIISPLADNILECTVNGFYVPNINQFIDSVEATDCITLTVVNGELTASPIIDPDTSNLLECRATGLFAELDVLDTTCIDVDITNGVISVEPIIDPKATNLLECGVDGLCVEMNQDVFVDSNCINFDVTNGLITAEPILAPDQGNITNILQCINDGLFVPVGGGITTLDSNCIELQLIAGVLTAEVIIDDVTPDNAITCGPNGLFVPICCPLVEDTDTVNLTLTSPRTITADVIIDPDGTNVLVANPTGLYVPTPFITTAIDSNCLDVEVVDGILTINPIISAEPDNALQCLVDGFHVPDCCPLVEDTLSVDLTLTGTRTITADVVVDPDNTNTLVINPGGLYVPEPFITGIFDTTCMTLTVTDGLLTIDPVISTQADNVLECTVDGLYVPNCCPVVEDTESVDLTLTGTNTISAEVIIDPLADNVLVANPAGLYVPPPLIDSVLTTPCIDVVVTDGLLTIDPIISATADNALQCLADGFYVPECCPIVVDTDSVDLTLTGTRTVTADVRIDPDLTNTLAVNPNGLFVPTPHITAVANTQCMTLDVTGGVLTATPIIDPSADNQLTCGVAGLYVPPAAGITTTATDCIDVDITGTEISATPIISGPIAGINNALQCTETGLYVPVDFISAVAPTDCINVQVVDGALIISPVLDPAADNLLTCGAAGLYVPPIAVVDTNCINLDITGTTLTANPIISAQADNALQCLADGFYVAECCPIVTDTTSVNLTLTGTRTISADVIIDPVADNALVLNPNGLFVPEAFIQAVTPTQCVDVQVVDGVLIINPIISPLADNQLVCQGDGLYVPGITVVDTNCIDLDFTNNVLTANPIISPQADNALQCLGDGLFVPDCCPQVVDTTTVDLTLINDDTIQADVIISGDAGNILLDQNGLFVPQDFVLAVADTNCIELEVNAGVLTANPILSALADNQLQCIGDGLYVPQGGGLAGLNTNCMTVTVNNGQISVDPIISGAISGIPNTLTCETTGLYVPELQVDDTDCMTLTLNANVLTADPILAPDQGLITNVAQCIVGQGIYVPAGAGLTVIDGNCVDLTLTNGNILQAEIIISPQINNAVTCTVGQGLFVNAITSLDTDCIAVDVTNEVITATPIIAPAQDLGGVIPCENAITCLPDGFYAPTLQFVDSQCMDFTVLGCEVTVEPIISLEPGNCLQCLPDGLYSNMTLQTATLDFNPNFNFDDTVAEDVWVAVPGTILPITLTQDGNVSIDFAHHIRAHADINGSVNLDIGYTVDGGAPIRFGAVHAVAQLADSAEQHMSSMASEFLTAGAHNIQIVWRVPPGGNALNAGADINWNQTEIKLTWLECAVV